MKIKAVCEATGLTDRTIRHYIDEGLIAPEYSENYLGRKTFQFSEEDAAQLKDISILRKFNFTVEEIRDMLKDAEKSRTVIQNVKNRTEQSVKAGQSCLAALSQVEEDKVYTVAQLAQELLTASAYVPETQEIVHKGIVKTALAITRAILIFFVVWLPIASQIVIFLATITYYSYPRFLPQAIVYMTLSVLPSIILLVFRKIRKTWQRVVRIAMLILCGISLQCSLVVFVLPVGIMAISETTDIQEYRDVDSDCLANRDEFFQNLFPVWPHYFENVRQEDGHIEAVYLDAHYYYRYFTVMDYTYDIYAEWPLETEAFYEEVDRVTQLFQANTPAEEDRNAYHNCITVQKGGYTCYVLYSSDGGDPVFEEVTDSYTYYIFAYDESNLRVRYLYCRSLENGADQPYYLSLDW